MPQRVGQRATTRGPRRAKRVPRGEFSYRLLRDSHIFASAVQEVLAARPLREASRLPITPAQLQLLALMSLDGLRQARDVASLLRVSPPAATKAIDKLEQLGLVVRTASVGDRRATLLSLSPKGRRLLKRYEQRKACLLTEILADFEPREIDRLARLLERFAVALLRVQAGEESVCLRCAAYIQDDCPVAQACGGCPYPEARRAVPCPTGLARGAAARRQLRRVR